MTDTIDFLLNETAREVRDVAPTTTLLDWLREIEGARGTKEGCAEGDCGACTVVRVLPDETAPGGVRYEALNSCLVMLPQVDGAHILTSEGLAEADGTLHPVQQAMVDTHGSQCGYCTPGFVMAMFAFHRGGEAPDEHTIHDMLAGNLCRCTGYRPIVDAVKQADGDRGDRFSADPVAAAGEVPRRGRGTATFEVDGVTFHAPRSLDDLVALRAAYPEARLLAGGTDLGLEVSKRRQKIDNVIHIAHVAELHRLVRTDSALEVGAAVTYTDALREIDELYPSMAALIRRIGSRQIRNLGTIGGNIGNASPIGDTPPCLIALGATLRLAGPQGVRTMPLEEYFLDYRKTALAPDEVIEGVEIPHMADHQQFHVYKISKRFDQDISAVVAAFRIGVADGKVTDFRCAYGGMAATPKRAAALEGYLIGKDWTAETAAGAGDALAADFAPISDFRATDRYRMAVALNLVRRLHLQTTGSEDSALEVMAL